VALTRKLRAFIVDARNGFSAGSGPDHARVDYRQKAWSAGLIVLFFAGWELFCLSPGCPTSSCRGRRRCSSPCSRNFRSCGRTIVQTLATTMAGFVLGVALGVALGAVIGVSRTAYDTRLPLLVGFSSIPKSRWCRSSCCGSAPARCRRC